MFGAPFANDVNVRIAELGFRTKPEDAGIDMLGHFVRIVKAERVMQNSHDPGKKLLEY